MQKCGRLACNNSAAGWWNERTKKFYCQPCAFAINESTSGLCVREIECCVSSPLDYANESEHGDLIEVEVGNKTDKRPRRYIVNIMERDRGTLEKGRSSSMYITDDLERIIALRNALNRIIEGE